MTSNFAFWPAAARWVEFAANSPLTRAVGGGGQLCGTTHVQSRALFVGRACDLRFRGPILYRKLRDGPMRKICKPFSCLLLVALCGCTAVSPRPVVPATYNFDCDVPAGSASVWNSTVTAKNLHVAGRIEFIELREHPRWASAASVYITAEETSVGLHLIRNHDTPTEVQLALFASGGIKQNVVFAEAHWEGMPIPFDLSLSESGTLSVNAAGKSKSMDLSSPKIQKITLSCSSAEVKFSEIVVSSR
jgi:hypothetical protein